MLRFLTSEQRRICINVYKANGDAMKRNAVVFAFLLLCGASHAQVQEQLNSQLLAVSKEIQDLCARLSQSEHVKQLREAEKNAEKIFENALTSYPEVREIDQQFRVLVEQMKTLRLKRRSSEEPGKLDRQIREVREQMIILRHKRMAEEKKHPEELAPKKAVLLESRQAVHAALDGDPKLRALRLKAANLMQRQGKTIGQVVLP